MSKPMTAAEWLKLRYNGQNYTMVTVGTVQLYNDYVLKEMAEQAERETLVKLEHFPHPPDCTNCDGMEQWYASIPLMKGMGESSVSAQDALYELMLSLEVKFAFENGIPLSEKRIQPLKNTGMKKLKTLDEHNNIARANQINTYGESPHLNGIACPECGKELYDTSPNTILTSFPAQKNTHCVCGYVGYRVA